MRLQPRLPALPMPAGDMCHLRAGGGGQVASQQGPDNHGVAEKGGSEDLDDQQDQEDREAQAKLQGHPTGACQDLA
jgi:hypothetical protein